MEYDSLIGKQLGAYRIQAKLGEGGMAWVHQATHEELQREAAIKVILPEFASEPDLQALFEREARLIARLRHRNIVVVYDFGKAENLMYLAMQYVGGGTLRDRLRSGLPLELHRAAIYTLQMARALHHAHCYGIIHRDVKPANMLISPDHPNELLLSDFGLAKLFGRQSASPSIPAIPGNEGNLPTLTKGAGTPAYMAPEQIEGRSLDARTDVYALGVVLFEMLTGQLPFRGDTPLSLYYQHVHVLPRPVREINPNVPEALARIAMRALAKSPEDRYQSAHDMEKALKALLVPPPLRKKPPVASSLPHHKRLFQAKSIAIALIILLIIVQIFIRLGILHVSETSFP